MTLRYIFHDPSIPAEYRHNFIHLYLDIGWIGVLSGSALAFLAIYAARLGASGFQIGLLGAMPAVVNLILAIPAGNWLQGQPLRKSVFWTSVWHRLGYFLWILLPLSFSAQGQVQALIWLMLLMSIPGTALAVGFNALFAEAVPPEWRAHVAGIRNAALSVTYVLTSVVCGWLLVQLPFPLNYQIVFGIGTLGAGMSSFHIWFVRPHSEAVVEQPTRPAGEPLPGHLQRAWQTLRRVDFLTGEYWRDALRTDIFRTRFRKILALLFAFHLTQFLAIPLFPLYFVRQLHLTDQQIGLGMAAFFFCVFIGSTQLARLSRRMGHQRVTGWGALLLSVYPLMLSVSRGFGLYLVTSLLGGLVWAMIGGALPNYLLKEVPDDDRPAHLAWYNIALNAAVLFGSLSGPVVADHIGLGAALVVFGLLRLLSGWFILRWG